MQVEYSRVLHTCMGLLIHEFVITQLSVVVVALTSIAHAYVTLHSSSTVAI